MKKIKIYTDGACSGNPGPGGWGAILIYEENKKEIWGASSNTTNNIMEITAVLEALKLLKEECEVEIYSDSAYVVNAFNQGWIYNWKKNNWKTANKEPVKKFIKVKGHSDNEFNNRCDYLATSAIKTL